MPFIKRLPKSVGIAVAVVLALGCVALVSATKGPYSPLEKAFYLDEKTVNFVRPGLVIRILSAEIAADGTARARVRFTDPRGLPLDRAGITTPGTIGTSMVLATIPRGEKHYRSYTVRTQTSPITGRSAIQAAADTGGTWTLVAEGEYNYTFGTRAPSGYDRTATHTVAAYGNRNLNEFDLGIHRSDTTFNFVPDGSRVTNVRDVIRTATCNKCHDKLSAHGTGGRQSMEVCIVCHTPQTTDPDTGNTVDMTTMVHKIHMGAELPSVQAGTKYQIIGNQQSLHDFSEIHFPPGPQRCEACHEPNNPATQKDAWLTPTRLACGSCHDNVNFATGQNHANLPQVSDNQCSNCHTVQGELEFDLSIRGAHTVPTASKTLPGTVFDVLDVNGGGPGQRPTVTFSIKDRSGKAILPSEMTRLALVLAGPTTDYKTVVSEDARQAQGANGVYHWTFTAPLPADAKGTFTAGVEGYRNQVLLPGTTKEQTVRDAGDNKVRHFTVTDSRVVARRKVVDINKCNACHFDLSLHGGNRNEIDQCVMCHNPTATDTARRPAAKNPPESIDFRQMIHRIHTGAALGFPYSVFGFGNTEHDYSKVNFPGNRSNCQMCHVGGSENVPLPATASMVDDPRGPLSPKGPETAACTSCHSSLAAASHALVNTSKLGESCAACHSASSQFSVGRVHAQ